MMKRRRGLVGFRQLATLSAVWVIGCPDPSAECQSNQDCREQEVCVDEACRRVCNSSGDCTSHERCVNGVCLPGEHTQDAASPDAGQLDSGLADAGSPDSGSPDSGSPDAGLADAGLADAGLQDTGLPDAGFADTSLPDAGFADTSLPDTGLPDAALPDTASPDSWTPQDGFADPWWDPSWQRRVRLRLHHAYSDEDQVDFILPVVLTPESFDYGAARPDGSDLVFVDPVGGQLPHEVERWDRGGRSTLWVAAPSLTAGSDQEYFYLYYGNPDATVAPTSSIYPPEYDLVLLMRNELSPTPPQDSSRHARAVSATGAPTSDPDGMIGHSLVLAAADTLEVPSLHGASFPQTTGTLSMVVKLDQWSDTAANLLDDFSASRDNFNLLAGDNALRVVAYHRASSSSTSASRWVASRAGWITVVMEWDLSRDSDHLHLHVGTSGRATSDLPSGWSPAHQQLLIGEHPFAGALEDLRLQRVARSRAWIDAHINALNDLMVVFEQAPVATEPEVAVAGVWAGSPVALYEFDELSGDTVYDSSGTTPSLDLAIADPSAVTWLPGALRVERATVIESLTEADKIVDACQATDEITVEAWVQPDNLLFSGPARMVSMSQDTHSGSIMLGQELDPWTRDSARYVFRLRTDQTDESGEMDVGSNNVRGMTPLDPSFAPRRGRTQVVFTRSADQLCVYVDGVPAPDDCLSWAGTFSPWARDRLRLANEWDPVRDRYARPWLGTYYRVAIYCEALSAAQIQQNFQAGHNAD